VKLVAPKRKVLRPARPNLGVRARYRSALVRMIDDMERSVTFYVLQAYRH